MNVEERKSVFEALSPYSDGSFELIAHVGTTNLRDSIELAQHAEAHRALAVAAVPPFYFRYSEETLFAFFKDLIESVSILSICMTTQARPEIRFHRPDQSFGRGRFGRRQRQHL